MSENKISPYVGPRPFDSEDHQIFFGRDTEVRELQALVSAYADVLLFAQSGAGKSSLINAGLIPSLKGTEIQILDPARVGIQTRDSLPDNVDNIYTYNVISTWSSSKARDNEISRMTLSSFLRSLPREVDEFDVPFPRLIILDQFEELFTTYPERWQDRQQFFEQVRYALDEDRQLSVLFSMREDFIAELSPYLELLPSRLQHRLRIERLKRTSALDAVIKPLEKTPVTYAPGVAEKIVEDLLTIRSSSGGEAIGEFAEPVHLQVVCQAMWNQLPVDTTEITQNFAEQYGNVSQALSQFYEECLTTLIQEAKVEESVLRDWFENKLITPDRKRDRIREEDTTTGDLPNVVVRRLATLHILRAETRGTVRWYELTHDRLIEPILRSNEFAKLLSQQVRVQQTAEAANLLLTKDSLSELTNLLVPLFSTEADRRSIVSLAFMNEGSLIQQLDYTGSSQTFVVSLIRALTEYGLVSSGEHALEKLLSTVSTQVGADRRSRLSSIIRSVKTKNYAVKPDDFNHFAEIRGLVYISYSRQDTVIFERISSDLQNAGLNIWTDIQQLKPGTREWDISLREAIRESIAVIYMASPNARRSPYLRDELAMAQASNKPIYPVWVVGENWMDAVPLGLGSSQYVDLRADHYQRGIQNLINTLSSIERSDLSVEYHSEPDASFSPRNPYKGLRAFREGDANEFFGRSDLINRLVIELTSKIEKQSEKMICLVGPSGSGKSSIIAAGLIPALKRGAIKGSENWTYLDPISPGSYPLEQLTIFLARQLVNKTHGAIREDLSDANQRGLYHLLQELSVSQVVLYIDQFEELFSLVEREADRHHFIDLLINAVTDPTSNLVLIVNIRADYYDRPMLYPALGRLIESNSNAVLPMSLADLYEVIQSPALLPDVNLTFDDGLVTELIFAIKDEPSSLPLLQFTLDQLYQNRDGRRLTFDAYHSLGGVMGALAQHAELTYSNLPSDTHRQLARALFLRLIEAGQTEQDTTRRRATYSELTLVDAEQTRILQETADAFVQARLLVTDQTPDNRTIEVSHNALIREWKLLGEWLHDAREDLRLQKSLSADVADWLRRGKPDDMLYRGTVLTSTQAWAERNSASRNEVEFITASQQAENQRRSNEQLVARRVQNFQRAAIVLGFVAILAVIATIVAAFAGINAIGNANQSATDVANAERSIAVAGETLTPIAVTLTIANNLQTTSEANATNVALQEARILTEVFVPLTPTLSDASLTPSPTSISSSSNSDWTPLVQDFDGIEMVLVPSGCFLMGSDTGDTDEQPVHEFCVQEFWMDRYEVTNAEYGSIGCEQVSSEPDTPINCVSWFDAQAFCEVRGGRLPTEVEWEYAARGPDSWTYPWGDAFVSDFAIYNSNSDGQLGVVGMRPEGASWIGALDLSGNVAEWVSSQYESYPYDGSDGRESITESDPIRVVRGGSWLSSAAALRSSNRSSFTAFAFSVDIGFRCVTTSE